MLRKIIFSFFVLLLLVGCEKLERSTEILDNASVRPAFSSLELNQFELPALQSLCQSFPNLLLDGKVQHEFDYQKEVCGELKETYRQGQKIDLTSLVPFYVANNRSLFYFSEIRFDIAAQGHALSLYCKNIANGNIDRMLDTGSGLTYTLEVIVNHSEKELIKNTPGCYDSSMVGASSSNALVCLRLWKDQMSNGTFLQSLSYESLTFIVSNALPVYSGHVVHRKKYDFLQCTDKSKALVYEATRIK